MTRHQADFRIPGARRRRHASTGAQDSIGTPARILHSLTHAGNPELTTVRGLDDEQIGKAGNLNT